MNSDGIIITLAYPDTIVSQANWEFSSKFLPYIGIGNKKAVQAGHAALLLIHKKNKSVDYFDFGRYITSYSMGRVRSKETDPELTIPLKAQFHNHQLTNFSELILWLDRYPDKTHGTGRLIASLNDCIDYYKAKNFIEHLIAQKEIPYGAFLKNGSNCARFVTDTLIAACSDISIKKKLKQSRALTPSPIGNVLKAKTFSTVYCVKNQKINTYTNRSILKEYGLFFKKIKNTIKSVGTTDPQREIFNPTKASWLGGIGSGAWFKIEEQMDVDHYKIMRYSSIGKKEFEGVFKVQNRKFDLKKEYRFVHPTNCLETIISQNNVSYTFIKVNKEVIF